MTHRPVREAQVSDAQGIASCLADIARESPLALLGGVLLDPSALVGLLGQPTDRYVILLSDHPARPEGPAAVLILVRGPGPSDHTANVAVGVHASARRSGLARQLVVAAAEWAKAQGVSRLTASVVDGNGDSLRLFRALGFHEEGRRVGHIRLLGEDLDEILFGIPVDALLSEASNAPGAMAIEGGRLR